MRLEIVRTGRRAPVRNGMCGQRGETAHLVGVGLEDEVGADAGEAGDAAGEGPQRAAAHRQFHGLSRLGVSGEEEEREEKENGKEGATWASEYWAGAQPNNSTPRPKEEAALQALSVSLPVGPRQDARVYEPSLWPLLL